MPFSHLADLEEMAREDFLFRAVAIFTFSLFKYFYLFWPFCHLADVDETDVIKMP
jgi:hypothetical protein